MQEVDALDGLMEKKHLINMLSAEFVATFALVVATVLAIASEHWAPETFGALGVAVTEGLVIAVMASAINDISGSHINPALTIAEIATKRMTLKLGVFYIITQVAGGIAGAATSGLILPPDVLAQIEWGTPQVDPRISTTGAFFAEYVLTFFLAFVFYGTVLDERSGPLGSLHMGFTVLVCVLVGYRISGGSINPARHIGPALVGKSYNHFWIYWAGPILGALTAGLLFHYRLHKTQVEGRGLETRQLYGKVDEKKNN